MNSQHDRLQQEARKLVGIPEDMISGDAAVAINYAIDMGYTTPSDVANMARKLLRCDEG